MAKKSSKNLDKHVRRFEECREELNEIGFILAGSIIKHYTKCYTPGCHCMNDSDGLHGPYYDWTRKVHGKTVTVRLTKEEANILIEWTDNKKLFYNIIQRMEWITLDAVKEIRV